MKNKLIYKVSKDSEGKKLGNYLKYEHKMSSRLIRKLVSIQGIAVNGKREVRNYVLKEGDLVEVTLDMEESQDIQPEDFPIEIAYEDEDLLIVNKPPYMVVHPTKSHQSGTLANGVMNYFIKTNQNCIVRLVNRLDRDTSGLVVIGKSQYAHQAMAKKMESNSINKYYITLVEGKMEGEGTIDLPIDRPSPASIKREVMEGGQRAVTHYRVLKSTEEMSMVLIKLETGKTHQIRVHMSHIGHPVLGDTLYGNPSPLIPRQALHAFKLEFEDVRNGREQLVVAEIPDDIKRLIDIIETQK